MEKAIVLSRVSTSQQDLTQQTDEILREAHKDGYTERDIIIIEDTESAINLTEEERQGLNKMKDHIHRDNSIQCVYIYELSRLSRRQLVLFSIRDFLVERKIQLICLKPYFRLLEVDGTMSQTGSLMFSLFSSLSESEMMLKKERMMRGRKHCRELGRSVGGRPPYGYNIDKSKRYVIHPTQSRTIHRIFTDYGTKGKTMREIATELHEEGLFPNTSINSLTHRIQKILKREIYTGLFPFPPIISTDLYHQSQQSIEEHREKRLRRRGEPFLLKGLICDAKTGYILSKNNAIESYFSKHHSGVSIRRNNIDPLVWEYSKMMYERYVMNKEILQQKIQIERQMTEKKISVLKRDISHLTAKLERLEESYILGRITDRIASKLRKRLTGELNLKDNRIKELIEDSIRKQSQRKSILLDTIDESLLTTQERIEIIHQVVDIITVEKPSLTYSVIKIYNKINSLVHIYQVHCWRHTWELLKETTSYKDPHVEIKYRPNKSKKISA